MIYNPHKCICMTVCNVILNARSTDIYFSIIPISSLTSFVNFFSCSLTQHIAGYGSDSMGRGGTHYTTSAREDFGTFRASQTTFADTKV